MSFSIKTLKYKDKVVFEKVRMETFDRIPKLFQGDEACFMFVQRGSFSIRMPDEFIPFSEGQGFLSKCFDYFFETSPQQKYQSEFIEVIGVLLFPEVVKDIFEIDIIPNPPKRNFNLKKVAIDSLLQNFKSSIDILLENPDLADEQMIKTKLKEFILLMLRTEEGVSQQAFLSSLFQREETEFKKTISSNMYSTLSVPEFAHLCGMSVSTFKRKFKKTFNSSPVQYLNTKKLEKASSLLAMDNLRISDIAYECGFNSISSFSRAFKEKYGKSPSEYRLT